MVKKSTLLFSILVLLVIGLFGVQVNSTYAQSKGFLVSKQLLDQAGLKLNWQMNMPIKATEKVDRIMVFDDYLLVLTDQNYLFCMNRELGTIRFETQLAVPGLPVCGPLYYEKQLYFVIGNELVVLDPSTGTRVESRKIEVMGKGTVCGFDRNSRFLYVLNTDKRFHALVADEYWQKFAVTADNDSLINFLIADEDFLLFSTTEGNVVRVAADGPKKKWQFDIPGRINAPIVRDDQWLYVSSENTKLYKLSVNSGNKGWESDFVTGEKLTAPAVIGQKVVYQNAGNKGLYAVDKETGRQVWHLPEGIGLISEKDSRAFVLAKPGMLVVMDNAKGTQRHSVNFATVSKYAANTTDSNIYISDDVGRLACIQTKE